MSWRLKAHQNDRSYVRELSGPTFDTLRKNLAWWAVTRRVSKTTELSKLREAACAGGCPEQYGYIQAYTVFALIYGTF